MFTWGNCYRTDTSFVQVTNNRLKINPCIFTYPDCYHARASFGQVTTKTTLGKRHVRCAHRASTVTRTS